MKKFNCPSCGAEVIFQSNVSVYAVCGYCSSMLVRRDVDVENIGKMAALPEDMSPFMIGSEGHYQNAGFRIVGRMKIGWAQGYWNEWYLLLNNGAYGWLAEAQGSYAISFEYKEDLPPETAKAIAKLTQAAPGSQNPTSTPDITGLRNALGSHLFIQNLKYKLVDIKDAVCLGSEGELPFAAPKGRRTLSIDLLGFQGEFGSVEISQGKTRIYLGRYLEWEQLRCKNLRPLEGWHV
jgi:hypothetical protein